MELKTIRITNLWLDLDNYRFEHQESQRDAINRMVKEYKDNLYNLAYDIMVHGLNPTDKPLVIAHPTDEGKYIVLEGNRRITTLKILINPNLIEDHKTLYNKFVKLHNDYKKALPSTVECGVCEDRDEANIWIERKHSKGLNGMGTQQWNSIQKLRFEEKTVGKASMTLQVINLLTQSPLVDESVKEHMDTLKVTNLERLISDPEVRQAIGISKKKDGRLYSDIDQKIVVEALVDIVKDVMNPDFNVKNVYHKEDRRAYLRQKFGEEGMPNTIDNRTEAWSFAEPMRPSDEKQADKTKKEKKKAPRQRATLIPRDCHLPIPYPRLAAIFKELRRLLVSSSSNTVAIMMRVFLEMSVDVYLEAMELLPEGKLTANDTKDTLNKKVTKVVDHLKATNAGNRDTLKGMEMAINNRSSCMSIETLNAYIHNHRLAPIASSLQTEWDNVQPFFEALWKAVDHKVNVK